MEVDPLPVQFSEVTGGTNSEMTGGALGGDWNVDGAIAPADAHWPASTPTWI